MRRRHSTTPTTRLPAMLETLRSCFAAGSAAHGADGWRRCRRSAARRWISPWLWQRNIPTLLHCSLRLRRIPLHREFLRDWAGVESEELSALLGQIDRASCTAQDGKNTLVSFPIQFSKVKVSVQFTLNESRTGGGDVLPPRPTRQGSRGVMEASRLQPARIGSTSVEVTIGSDGLAVEEDADRT